MPRHCTVVLSLAALLLLAGCPDPGGTADGGAGDGKATDGSGSRCTTYDYVINELQVPSSPAEAQRIGYDFDNDGTRDNGFGSMLAAMYQAGWPGFRPVVETGKMLLLLRIGVFGRISPADPSIAHAYGFLWNADAEACATSCFSGRHRFTNFRFYENEALSGQAKDSLAILTGYPVHITLSFSTMSRATVRLVVRDLSVRLRRAGLSKGVLPGAVVSRDEISTQLVPALAKALDVTLKDPASSQQRKTKLATAFDADGDGTITAKELAASEPAQKYLAGDVDIDQDGTREVSMSLRFSAVGARIVPEPGPCILGPPHK